MGQYISVYLDSEERNYKNKGLYDIIVFIGKKSYEGKKDLSSKEAFKRGKRVLNSKLHKWHSTTIQKLVTAERKKYAFDYDEKMCKPVWKIHRKKAQKVFRMIRLQLKHYGDKEVLSTFDKICNDYSFQTGVDAAGTPYYATISDERLLVSQNYDDADIKALKKCAEVIEKFSIYHSV